MRQSFCKLLSAYPVFDANKNSQEAASFCANTHSGRMNRRQAAETASERATLIIIIARVVCASAGGGE